MKWKHFLLFLVNRSIFFFSSLLLLFAFCSYMYQKWKSIRFAIARLHQLQTTSSYISTDYGCNCPSDRTDGPNRFGFYRFHAHSWWHSDGDCARTKLNLISNQIAPTVYRLQNTQSAERFKSVTKTFVQAIHLVVCTTYRAWYFFLHTFVRWQVCTTKYLLFIKCGIFRPIFETVSATATISRRSQRIQGKRNAIRRRRGKGETMI